MNFIHDTIFKYVHYTVWQEVSIDLLFYRGHIIAKLTELLRQTFQLREHVHITEQGY